MWREPWTVLPRRGKEWLKRQAGQSGKQGKLFYRETDLTNYMGVTPMGSKRVSAWSGIRNKLENDYLCPALRGHIQYFAVSYSRSADHEGRAAIRLDGVEILRSNYYDYDQNYWDRYKKLRVSLPDENAPGLPFRLAHEGALKDGCFDNWLFYEAFHIFDNQSIEKSLVCENPLVRIFALLDRRLGKRRLLALAAVMEQELEWGRAFYVIRMQAEGLMTFPL